MMKQEMLENQDSGFRIVLTTISTIIFFMSYVMLLGLITTGISRFIKSDYTKKGSKGSSIVGFGMLAGIIPLVFLLVKSLMYTNNLHAELLNEYGISGRFCINDAIFESQSDAPYHYKILMSDIKGRTNMWQVYHTQNDLKIGDSITIQYLAKNPAIFKEVTN